MGDSVITLDSLFPHLTTDQVVDYLKDIIEKDQDEWIVWNQDKTEVLGRHKKKKEAIAQFVKIETARKKEKVKNIDGDVLPVSAYEKELELDELEIIKQLD